jgi:hypothetical protein
VGRRSRTSFIPRQELIIRLAVSRMIVAVDHKRVSRRAEHALAGILGPWVEVEPWFVMTAGIETRRPGEVAERPPVLGSPPPFGG